MTIEEKITAYEIIQRGLSRYQKDDWRSYTSVGQDFIQNELFPAIQQFIQKEIQKDNPNMRAIWVLNYAVSLIGYDYYLADKANK